MKGGKGDVNKADVKFYNVRGKGDRGVAVTVKDAKGTFTVRVKESKGPAFVELQNTSTSCDSELSFVPSQ